MVSVTQRDGYGGWSMPDPSAARTPAEFARCLNALMLWANRSHRGVAKHAGREGERISYTTAANLTAGSTRPELGSVIKFLVGCGLVRVEEQTPWVDKYRELFPRQPAALQRARTRPDSAGPLAATADQTRMTAPRDGRGAYLTQVARIAPYRLRDRDAELAELVEFCTAEQGDPYMWWRAGAWAGKSALLSWFVLHPPPGVHLVSFFITARFAGQSDRNGFIDVVMEQLAELTGRPVPTQLADATRDGHLMNMLSDAADVCRKREERLVLVVDGLDEDRGVSAPNPHSVAALLPARPPAGMRVVVAGRPNPQLPPGLPEDHPLLDPRVVRVLTESPHAKVVKDDAERELDHLLYGTPAELDTLGLLAAAVGGLSGQDLAELLDCPMRTVERQLNTVSGRTFSSRPSRWRPGSAPQVYVLGHEELQRTAERFLGEMRLAGYRRQLHGWAASYFVRRWPPETPEYLLYGYSWMLRAHGDLPGLLALVTDVARHDRLREVTGADAAALGEIHLAQQFVLERSNPDLVALARLAVRCDMLAERNAHAPCALAEVWARSANPARAESLARSITDPGRQSQALAALVRIAAKAGDVGWAKELAVSISEPVRRAEALATAAVAQANAGDSADARTLVDEAEAIAHISTDPVKVLCAAATALAGGPDSARARELADHAEASALTLTRPARAAEALSATASALAACGEADRAGGVALRAEAAARLVTGALQRNRALAVVAPALERAGDSGRAYAVAQSITDMSCLAGALAAVAGAAAEAGEFERAEGLARSITDPFHSVGACTAVARALADAGQAARARALAAEAEVIARRISDRVQAPEALAAVAVALAVAGVADRARHLAVEAETAAHTITNPVRAADVLSRVAAALADVGDRERSHALAVRAEDAARMIPDWHERSSRLSIVAEVFARAGDRARAGQVVASTIDVARQPLVLKRVAAALVAVGDLRGALETADSIGDADIKVGAMSRIAVTAARAGHVAWALKQAKSISDYYLRDLALRAVTRATLDAGEVRQALEIAELFHYEDERVKALAEVALTMAGKGDIAAARVLIVGVYDEARRIDDSEEQAEALIAVAAATACIGNVDGAQTIVDSIALPEARNEAAAAVAAAAGYTGHGPRLAFAIDSPAYQAKALIALAQTAATAGDAAVACILAIDATDAARLIDDPYQRAAALIAASVPAARAGDAALGSLLLDEAEALCRRIPHPDLRIEILTDVAIAAAQAGDAARAVVVARSIRDSGQQAKAIGAVITALLDASHIESGRAVLQRTLVDRDWLPCLNALISVEPTALLAIAEELAATIG